MDTVRPHEARKKPSRSEAFATPYRTAADIGETKFHMTSAERRSRLGDFLKTKRASIGPEMFALPLQRRRRVPGLRREELAFLAGMSVTWYTQLESGAPITVSTALLRRLSDTLGLSELERAYLFSLAIDELGIVSSVLGDLEVLAGSRIVAPSLSDELAMGAADPSLAQDANLRGADSRKCERVATARLRGSLPDRHLAA